MQNKLHPITGENLEEFSARKKLEKIAIFNQIIKDWKTNKISLADGVYRLTNIGYSAQQAHTLLENM